MAKYIKIIGCNIPYTRFKKPLYTVYPKTLADPAKYRQKPNTQVLLFLFVALCCKTYFEPIYCVGFSYNVKTNKQIIINKTNQNKAYKETQKMSREKIVPL